MTPDERERKEQEARAAAIRMSDAVRVANEAGYQVIIVVARQGDAGEATVTARPPLAASLVAHYFSILSRGLLEAARRFREIGGLS